MGKSAFGIALVEEREAHGHGTQTDFAEALRKHPLSEGGYPSDALVGHWERGDRAPSFRGLRLVSAFFGWDVRKRAQMEDLLAGSDAVPVVPDLKAVG